MKQLRPFSFVSLMPTLFFNILSILRPKGQLIAGQRDVNNDNGNNNYDGNNDGNDDDDND